MPPIAANDNHPRPAGFDAAVMAYQPGMRSLARKLGYRGQDASDLVTDTIAYCLEHWANFHGQRDKMWNWIYWQMRGIVRNRRNRNKIGFSDSEFVYENAAVEGTQAEYADLSTVLGALKGRSGDMTLRMAMGDTLDEVGRSYGVSRERVRQLVEKERSRLRAMMGGSVLEVA